MAEYIGSELKYKVVIAAAGFDIDRDDFQIECICGSKKKLYQKKDILLDGQGNYYLAVDTTGFKKGTLYAVTTMYIPDEDFPDGLRTEVDKQKLDDLWDVRK